MATATKCDACRFAVLQDSGWSNWTVTGTDFFCGKNLHPDDGFDTYYSKEPGLLFAASCPEFSPGGPGVEMDVEGEMLAELTAEQRALYDVVQERIG